MLTRTIIEKYFNAVKQEGLLLMGHSTLSLLLFLGCWLSWKTQLAKGAAWPLLLTGLLLLPAGYTAYRQSDALRVQNVYALDMNPAHFREKEQPRLQAVQRSLWWWCLALALLAATGIAVCMAARHKRPFLLGWGMALAIQALLMLAEGTVAAQRARAYRLAITGLLEQLS